MRPDAHDGLRVAAAFFGGFVLTCLGVLVGLPVLLILGVVFGWGVFCAEAKVQRVTYTTITNNYPPTATPNARRVSQ